MKNKDKKSENQETEWEDQELPLFDNNNGSKSEQSDISAALPPRPEHNLKDDLQSTTAITFLPSIVSPYFLGKYRGINWPHYENMLKLYALDFFVNGEPTEQQKRDREELQEAIEVKGNLKYKKKHVSFKEVIESDTGVYMNYGKDVIRALVFCDRKALQELHAQILNSYNSQDSRQREAMYTKASLIYKKLKDRYCGRE